MPIAPGIVHVVAVVGPVRSGTSCVAGTLHTLGVSMGMNFAPPAPSNPKGFYEAVNLRSVLLRICRRPMLIPWTYDVESFDERVALLRRHVECRSDASVQNGRKMLGVKHPFLCPLVDEMLAAWSPLKIVSVTRAVSDVVQSMETTRWFGRTNGTQKSDAINWLIRQRDEGIARNEIPCLALTYPDLTKDPKATVDSLIRFLEIEPDEEKIAAAVGFIDSSLNHMSVAG